MIRPRSPLTHTLPALLLGLTLSAPTLADNLVITFAAAAPATPQDVPLSPLTAVALALCLAGLAALGLGRRRNGQGWRGLFALAATVLAAGLVTLSNESNALPASPTALTSSPTTVPLVPGGCSNVPYAFTSGTGGNITITSAVIDATNPARPQFFIRDDTCTGNTLTPSSQCAVTLGRNCG